ncbi:MAG TPA: YciI family protein [Acidobacteriaceae bacterium]|jgi:hypothetical protein|nr:YciI family protein [Acidobacteriaceae bacterium]
MQYLLMDYVQEQGWDELTKDKQEYWLGAYVAYMEAMKASGVLKSSNGLHSASAATTVRFVNDKAQVLDGPYADTKEQLGGFHIIDVPDLDAALAWAARSPTAMYGVVEVRPIRNVSISNLMSTSDAPVTMHELLDSFGAPKPPAGDA